MPGDPGFTDAVQKAKHYFGSIAAGAELSPNFAPANPDPDHDQAPWDIAPTRVARPHMPNGEDAAHAAFRAGVQAARALAAALRTLLTCALVTI